MVTFSDSILTVNQSETIKISNLALELKLKGHDIISLSAGEPDFDTPEDIKISAIEKMEFYSLSIPIGGQKKAEIAIKKAFNCLMPLPGDCSVCREYKVKILRLSKDQIFLYFGFQDIIRIEKSLKVMGIF